MSSQGSVEAVAASEAPKGGYKDRQSSITLKEDSGARGDYHAGKPNRHVSLLRYESLEELNHLKTGNDRISPGELGENITTMGLKLAELNQGTKLKFIGDKGDEGAAVIELTGLRRAGDKLNNRRPGLKDQCTVRDASGTEVGSRVGVFGVVAAGGLVKPGMSIIMIEPTGDLKLLEFL